MRVEEIRRLIKLVEESQIDVLEVRRGWTRVRIQKAGGNHRGIDASGTILIPQAAMPPATQAPAARTETAPAPLPAASSAPAPPPAGPSDGAADSGLVPIRSPMVGTFYRSSSPQAPPYVEAGGRVEVGGVVCIVEAMKLMNEIESEVAGRVERILVENGQPVEFNQTLFLVRPGG